MGKSILQSFEDKVGGLLAGYYVSISYNCIDSPSRGYSLWTDLFSPVEDNIGTIVETINDLIDNYLKDAEVNN